MRHYTKILIGRIINVWISCLNSVNSLLSTSIIAVRQNGGAVTGIEEDTAREARLKINLVRNEVRSIILISGASYTYEYTPPPVVGGSKHYIDVITNMFYLIKLTYIREL